MKIKDILENNIDNEQKLALEQVLNLSKPELTVNKERELTKREYKKYKKINKRLKKEPIQYILKKAYFYNNEFYVNKHVLIPRPETEVLVEKTNNLINKHFKNKKINILDIGTGSGVIAITLKQLNKNTNVTATDIKTKCIQIARRNSKSLNTNVEFIKTNLYKGIEKKFEVIISNPPYIDENSTTVEEKVRNNEPKIALFAKDEGLSYYREILKNIDKILRKRYIIAFEIGENQGKKIEKIAKEYLPNSKVIIEKDYNGFDRYLFIKGVYDGKLKNI